MSDATPNTALSLSLEELATLREEAERVLRLSREAEESCTLHIPVEGVLTPLRDCDWVLVAPCGHAVSLMSAVSWDDVVPDAEAAWHELYSTEPHAHRRVRDREIKRMKSDGYDVVPMLRSDAATQYTIPCPHTNPTARKVEDAGSVDAYAEPEG